MKKLLLTLLSVMFVLSASAETITGNAGSNINWSYDTEDHILTFTGSGAMPNYSSSSNTSWGKHVLYTISWNNREFDCTILDDVDKIIIGDGITSIGNSCFDNCDFLKTVELTSSVKSIGSNAFYGCGSLATIEGELATDLEIGSNAFNGTQLVSGSILYMGTTLVQVFPEYSSSSLSIKSGTTKINASAINGCTGITSITIPSSVTTIGDYAFAGCTGLTTLNFANASNITSWGSNIFSGCKTTTDGDYKLVGGCVITDVVNTSKKKYTISSDIVYIAENAFAGCSNTEVLDLSGCTTAPKLATGALGDVPTTKTTLVVGGYESNFGSVWGNVNATKIQIYNNRFVSRTFLHNAVSPKNVAVYRAVIKDAETVTLTKINADNVSCEIPAGEGVFLRATTAGEYTFSSAKKQSVASIGTNHLKGVTDDKTFDGSENAYIISTVNGVQDFYRIASTYTLPMGKAYLDGGNTLNMSKLGVFDDETSGIEESTISSAKEGQVYNMAGQRMNSPMKGINIINGKKYIVE